MKLFKWFSAIGLIPLVYQAITNGWEEIGVLLAVFSFTLLLTIIYPIATLENSKKEK